MRTKVIGLVFIFFILGRGHCGEIPDSLLKGLEADEFNEREISQAKLLEWAKSEKNPPIRQLAELAESAEEPEVRQRCSRILKGLSDADYFSEGQGFLGIFMQDEIGAVEGDDQQRAIIRITGVFTNSPAAKAGLNVGDVIVAIDGEIWRNQEAMISFKNTVSKKKPTQEVVLKVRGKDNQLVDLKVILGKNPIQELRNTEQDLDLLDEQARARHFKDWLKEQGVDDL
jgi:predicted metalloprotease with PDZ domain